MDLSRIEIDGKACKVIFHGTCSEMLGICKANCCRERIVAHSKEEFASGCYQAKAVCKLSNKECRALQKSCRCRDDHLDKKPAKSCIYRENDQYTIYNIRPQVCRDFQFKAGMGGID